MMKIPNSMKIQLSCHYPLRAEGLKRAYVRRSSGPAQADTWLVTREASGLRFAACGGPTPTPPIVLVRSSVIRQSAPARITPPGSRPLAGAPPVCSPEREGKAGEPK